MQKVKPIPQGMHSVTPHLVCAGAAKAIDFYKKAFGAEEGGRLPGDRYGKIEDPFGHHWSVGTHVRDVTPEEMKKAMQAMAAGQKQGA